MASGAWKLILCADAMPELLILKPSSLGDIVHGLQVATSIKAQWPSDRPQLRIGWVVRDMFAPLVRSCEAVDHIYLFRRFGGVLDFLRLMREVRETHYDYLFDFQGLLRTGLMAWRTPGAKKYGRSDAREGASLFYDEKVPLPVGGRNSHALDILLQFCPVLGLRPELQGALRFREPSNLNLAFADGKGGTPPIVMFPDSRRAEKRWPGFPQLTELILREDRTRRVVWAGNSYLPYKGARFPSDRFLNLTGNTSLLSLPALIRRAGWVISNDSGPMHLAAALGTRTLGIFGPTDPRLFGPYPFTSPTNHVVQAPVGDLRMLPAKEVFARFQRIDALALRSDFRMR